MDPLMGFGGPRPAIAIPTQEHIDLMNRVTRLNEVGVDRPATIKWMQTTGRSHAGGLEYAFDVEVRPVDGAAYSALFTQIMHVATMDSSLREGKQVTVRVDPDDPRSMILVASC